MKLNMGALYVLGFARPPLVGQCSPASLAFSAGILNAP